METELERMCVCYIASGRSFGFDLGTNLGTL